MSVRSLHNVIDKGLVEFASINLERDAYKKSGQPARHTLEDLASRCTKLQSILAEKTISDQIEQDLSLQMPYAVLMASLATQQKKLQKLIAILPPQSGSPLSSKKIERLPSEHGLIRREPQHVGILRNTLRELQAGKEKQGLAQIRTLEKTNPEIAKRIFGEVYKAAGSPTRKSHPKIAHDHFGRVAFYGEENRNVSLKIKESAVRAVLTELVTPVTVKPRVPPKDKKDIDGYRYKVWKETLKVLEVGKYTNSRDEVVTIDTSSSIKDTLAYPDAGPKLVRTRIDCKQELLVIDQDCLTVAERFSRAGLKVSLLNMANDEHPGGAVRRGGNAQEEEVSRRTGLIDAICTPKMNGKQPINYYPLLKTVGPVAPGLYSPNVPVFRKGMKDGYALLDDPFHISILTVAAYKLDKPKPLAEIQKQNTKERIRTMLEMAYQNHDDVVVLSAFGCGAYNNKPDEVTILFQEVIDQYYPNAFHKIIFAIIDDQNAKNKDGNFRPFARHFIQHGAQVINNKEQPMTPEDLGLIE